MQQDGCVHSAAFSPDGHRIVTASADHSARIWDAQTGRPILETLIHEGEVWHAEFSPDGQRILTVSGDRTARLWDAHTGEMRVPPLVHQSPVRCGVFSADGRRIATGCSDGSVRVWDAETGLSLSDPIHLPAPLHTVRFDRDGKRLVLVPAWGALRSWDLGVAPVPCDPWIPDLAEAVAGCRYGRRWLLEPVPFEDSLALRDRIRALSDSGFYTTWAQWFLAPIDNRTLSASSPTATADYIQRRIQDDSIESLWEAVRLSRTNALALARLAQLFTMPTGTDDPTRAGQAEFLSRRAARLAPHDPAVTKTLDEIDGLRRFLRSRPTSPDILPQP
jgi:hypothetical protein